MAHFLFFVDNEIYYTVIKNNEELVISYLLKHILHFNVSQKGAETFMQSIQCLCTSTG
jgi:hypothetical protein